MAIRPFANAPHADRNGMSANWLIGVQTGNTPNDVNQMKYLTLDELTSYVRSTYGSMWNYRGSYGSATPTDPMRNDYFVCTGNFTGGSQSFVSGHIYAYNGNTWDDVSNVLIQYVQTSAIADNLTTDDPTKVLSANQGKILNDTRISDVADLQQQIDAISGGITPKGTIATESELPDTSQSNKGWMYYVTDIGKYKVFNGTQWVDFGAYPIEEYASRSSFPEEGVGQKLYISIDNSRVYRWDGSQYVSVSTDRLAQYDFREVDPFEGFVLEGDSQQNLETMVRNSEADPYNGFMLDLSEVDPSDGFVLDGDRAQSLEGMVKDSDVNEQDAIMLSIEPVIPTASTHNFGIRGQIAIDDSYLYVCVADNTWKKIPLQNL